MVAGGSGGIGRAVVERLARVGIAVGVHYAGNKARTTTVTAAGGRAIAVGGDIADEHATAEASDAVGVLTRTVVDATGGWRTARDR